MSQNLSTKLIKANKTSDTAILWLHGWGNSINNLLPLAESFNEFHNYLFDLPGFGQSLPPKDIWGSKEYGNYLSKWIKENLPNNIRNIIIVGHSFGCKVGIHIANNNTKVKKLILLAAARTKRNTSLKFRIKSKIITFSSKIISLIEKIFKIELKNKIRNIFQSYDYKAAQGIMKNIFSKVVIENIEDQIATVKIPTLIIYGKDDTETPISIGKTYNKLLTNSKFIVLPNTNHWNIITTKRHQIINLIQKFLGN